MDCIINTACVQAITRDIAEDCENRIHSGIQHMAIIINKDDILGVAFDPANRRHVTGLTLKTGARAYMLDNVRNNPFTGTNTQLQVGDFRNTYTRTVAFFVPLDGWETSKDILDPIANGKYVVIMQNEWLHTNSKGEIDNEYQIYGLDKGCTVSSMVQTKYENDDVWSIEMTEEGVANSGRFIKVENVTDTTISAQAVGQGGDGMSPWLLTFTDPDGNSVSHTFADTDIVSPDEPYEGFTSYVEFTNNGNTWRFYFSTQDSTIDGEIFSVENTCEYLKSLVETKVEP
ncbi:MAG: hypothetical protein IIT32_08465 [Bacteroidales bacterium]|nr:hypothetical protein [Bacteroidales bacterium]